MSQILPVIQLDFYTVKPYKKSLYPLIMVGIIMSFLYGDPSGFFASFFMMGLVLFAAFPFSIAERNNTGTLHMTLPLRRENIVIGRYAFASLMGIIGIIFVFFITMVSVKVFSLDLTVEEALLHMCLLIMIFCFIISVQYPLFFKLGYTKARLIAYLPFLSISLFAAAAQKIGIISALNKVFDVISKSALLMYGAPVAIGILLLLLSCLLSCKIYEKREF